MMQICLVSDVIYADLDDDDGDDADNVDFVCVGVEECEQFEIDIEVKLAVVETMEVVAVVDEVVDY